MTFNRVMNGSMAMWQSGASLTLAAATGHSHCDGWSYSAGAGFAGYQIVRAVTPPTGLVYGIRYIRTAAGTNTGQQMLIHDMESVDSRPLAGKTVVCSFWARVGANWSPTTGLTASLETGTGTDAARRSGAYAGADVTSMNVTPNTGYARFSFTKRLATTATQLCVYFSFTPVGTAGANDWVDITGVQIEIGDEPSDFLHDDRQRALERCQRRYYKSFHQDDVPVQNFGTTAGAYFWTAVTAGATAQRGLVYPLPTTMRVTPTITTFNPLAANAEARDATGAADCTGTTAAANDNAVWFLTTGAAGTAVGNRLAVHFVADARI